MSKTSVLFKQHIPHSYQGQRQQHNTDTGDSKMLMTMMTNRRRKGEDRQTSVMNCHFQGIDW